MRDVERRAFAYSRGVTTSERSWPLLTLREALLYVPGVAVLLCGGTLAALAVAQLFGADPTEIAPARGFVLAVTPLMLIVPAIPMLAFGGRLHARVDPGRLEVVRSRARVMGTPIVLARSQGPITLRIDAFRGRMRSFGSLTAIQGDDERVLVTQGSLIALRRIAAELEAMLDGSKR